MAVKKIQIIPPGYTDVLHPETETDMVLCNDGKTLTTQLILLGTLSDNTNTNNYVFSTGKNITVEDKRLYSFMCANASTGNITIKIDNNTALPLKNRKTNAQLGAGKIGAYQLFQAWYSSDSNCFFLRASAEGTADVADVLATKTFSNDNDTGLTGTMINRKSVEVTARDKDITTPTKLRLYMPNENASYDGNTVVSITDPNFVASNIPSGLSMFGLAGTNNKTYGVGDGIPIEKLNSGNIALQPSQYWRNDSGGYGTYANPCILGSHLYITSALSSYIAKFTASTGVMVSNTTIGIAIRNIDADNTRNCLFIVGNNTIQKRDANLGLVWETSSATLQIGSAQFTSSYTTGGGAFDAGYIYAIDNAGYIYKVNKDTGALVWRVATTITGGTGRILANDNYLYLVSFDGSYFVSKRNKTNGAEILSYTTVRGYCCALSDDGTVYLVPPSTGQNIRGYKDSSTASYVSGNVNNIEFMKCIGNGVYLGTSAQLYKFSTSLTQYWSYSFTGFSSYNVVGVLPLVINGNEYIVATSYYVDCIKPFFTIR